MKILGICGSPKKKNSTTLFALQKALATVEKLGISSELISLSDYSFSGCLDCNGCKKEIACAQLDDFTDQLLPKLLDQNISGLILASPVYFGGVTSLMKSFLDRSVVLRRNGFLLQNKIGGAITVGKSRHGGQELTSLDLIKYFLIQGMIVVPDCSPTSHFGGMLWSGKEGGVEKDEMGIQTAENVGRNVAQTIHKLFKKD